MDFGRIWSPQTTHFNHARWRIFAIIYRIAFQPNHPSYRTTNLPGDDIRELDVLTGHAVPRTHMQGRVAPTLNDPKTVPRPWPAQPSDASRTLQEIAWFRGINYTSSCKSNRLSEPLLIITPH
jgi:hypothetical protein